LSPLLSIVIATKNREFYCIEAIKSILLIDSIELELAIADNSDTDEIKIFIESIFDSRLKYVYDNSLTSSIANFNRALSLATGDYVCMIGDDDGINPEIIEISKWAKMNNIDALVGSLSANYRWENTGAPDTLFTKMTGSTLTISSFDGKAEFVDLRKSLVALMRNGATNYLDFKLPKLYHGIVKRDILQNIKNETGEYLKGLSPDIYSAVILAHKVKNLVYIDYPITIPGVCGTSTSIIEGQKKANSKKIEDIPHLKYRGAYTWNKNIPRFYCVQTIWGDSCFAALDELSSFELKEKFNKFYLYANILIANPRLLKLVYNDLYNENSKSIFIFNASFKIFFAYLFLFIKINVVKRLMGRLKIIFKISRFKIIRELFTISYAMNSLTVYIKQNKISKAINELTKLSK
jgi:glycosyltransferase involved in cell wall biosynthesis